ncbi:MAG: hypothetical protein OHK0046_44140 [Anaerolineae bacterium]
MLRQVRGVGPKIATAITMIDLSATEAAMQRWMQAGVHILTWADPLYPAALRAVEDAPPTLFVRGHIELLRALPRMLAVVGTRTPSAASRDMAGQIGAAVAEIGGGLVSGLAAGVDAAAHIGALSVPGTVQIAVLGSGILRVYPPEHRALAEAVMQHGVLACEVAPDAPVSTPGLVARNRIITGIAETVIVVETEADGGAMHAARFATMQGKRLVAVENSASGNQQLLAAGALPFRLEPLIALHQPQDEA